MDSNPLIPSQTVGASYEAPQNNLRWIVLIIVIVLLIVFAVWFIWYLVNNSNTSGGSGSSGSPDAAKAPKAPSAPEVTPIAPTVTAPVANDFIDEVPEVLSVTPQKGETSGETINEKLEDMFKADSDLSTPQKPAATTGTPAPQEKKSDSDLSPPAAKKLIKLPTRKVVK